MYYIETWYSKDSYLNKQIITNVITGKTINSNDLKTNYNADLYPNVVGIINGKIYYTYQQGVFSTENILEVLDTKTGKVSTLLNGGTFGTKIKFQLLKSGNQIVLKIFDNKKLHKESIIWGLVKGKPTAKNFNSKYANEPAKYISLNTLKEINGISGNFEPIVLYSRFTNAGNGQTQKAYITFDISDLNAAMTKSIKLRKLKPLF